MANTITTGATVITPESLQTPVAITPVTPTPDTTNYGAIQSNIGDTIAADFNSANQAKIDQENLLKQNAKDVLDATTASLSGKSDFTRNANETTGVNAATSDVTKYASQLAELNGQMTSLNREASKIPLQIENQSIGQGITLASQGVQTNDALRNNAIKALSIAQQADVASAALTGSQFRLKAAQDKVAQMVDLEFKPKEDALALKKQQYELNKEALTAIDKRRTEALGVALKKEEQKLAEEKADKKAKDDMILNASVANAPTSLINAARAAKTPMDAAVILKEYAGDYYQTQLLKAQIEKQKADTSKVYSDAKATRDAASGSSSGVASSTAKDWVTQYNSGALSLEDIYTKIGSSKEALKLKNEVASLIAAQGGKRVYGADDNTIQAINSQIKNVDDLLKGDVGSIVGLVQGGLGVLPDSMNIYKQDALAVAKNLTSNQTLQALADAKSKGITFGALSEKELSTIAESASRISAKLKMDKDGNIIGFSGSEGEFKKDLKAIKAGLEKSIEGKVKSVAPNPFQQAVSGSGNATPILGTKIISNVSSSGAIDFAIPK